MKKISQKMIAILLLCMLTGCSKTNELKEQENRFSSLEVTKEPIITETSMVTEKIRKEDLLSPDSLEEYDWYLIPPKNNLSKYDLSNSKDLLSTICFSNYTKFPQKEFMPKDISMNELLKWGIYPGLHMDVLYKHELTGKNAVVGIIDQPFLTDHEAFKDTKIIYHDLLKGATVSDENSMHGGAVTSLLATPEIGTAPNVTVHFYEEASWGADFKNTANIIYEIIETNKSLPENEKISMVSISDYSARDNKNQDKLWEALEAAKKAGVWIWMADYPLKMNDGAFSAFVDKDDPKNMYTAYGSNATPWTDISWENVLTIPAGGRTTAYTFTNHMDEYTYWADGGVSWSVPYLCGLAATAHMLASDLTQDEMCEIFLSTADSANDLEIINPVRFMAKVLRHSGDDNLADTILNEAGINE